MDNSRVFYSECKPSSRRTAEGGTDGGRGGWAREYSHKQFDIPLSSSQGCLHRAPFGFLHFV